jgi:endonuclease/exonuclease/phosphatase (EEP) superfamily protein YafD
MAIDTAWRRRGQAALWTLSTGSLAWAALRGTGWEPAPLVPLLAFTPLAAGGSVLPLVAAVAGRRWATAVPAALALSLFTACLAPRAIADRPVGPGPGSGVALPVMTANLLAGGADPATIVRLVRANDIAVLALQEFTGQARSALTAAGLDTLFPYASIALPRTSDPFDTTGSALYSRYPLSGPGVRLNVGGFQQAYATVEVPSAGPVAIESAHPVAPHSLAVMDEWRTDLGNEPVPDPDGPPRILLGDFNATLDHAALRRLIGRGYRDAADATGQGLRPTWGPYAIRPVKLVTIDHVLVDRRVGVSRVAVHALPRSDHRAVVADLWLPARR